MAVPKKKNNKKIVLKKKIYKHSYKFSKIFYKSKINGYFFVSEFNNNNIIF